MQWKTLGDVMQRNFGPCLPDCTCATRKEDERCPIHAPGARRRHQRRAWRAVERGEITREAYYEWLDKYRKSVVKPFGSIF